MAKCPKCGRESPDQARFCRTCGAPMAGGGETAPGPPGGTPEQRAQRLLEEAFRLSEESRILGAIQACQQALTINPNSVSAHSLLATLYERQGDRDAAIREYEQVLTLSPESTVERRRLNELMGVPTAGMGVRISVRTARLALTGAALVVAFVLIGAILFYTQKQPSPASRAGGRRAAMTARLTAPEPAAVDTVPAPGRRWTLGPLPPPVSAPRARPPRAAGGSGGGGQAPRDQFGQWVAPGTYLLPNRGLPPAYAGGGARASAAPPPPIVGAVPYQGTPVVGSPPVGPPQGMARVRARGTHQRARDYYFAGDYQGAIAAYQSYLAQHPQAGPGAREELAWVYLASGSKSQAAQEYQRALKEYQADLQRGQNVEAARHGIRTCEAAIRAVQGQ